MGPLGLLSPHPGVSYLFSGDTQTQGGSNLNANPHHHSNPNLHQPTYPVGISNSGLPPDVDMSGSLWSIAHATSGSSGSMAPGGTLSGPLAAIWMNSYGEMVLKIDSKLKVCVLFSSPRRLQRWLIFAITENNIGPVKRARCLRTEWDQG